MEFYGQTQVYSASGVDLTLLRENLRRTVTERLLRNEKALAFCREMDRGNPYVVQGKTGGETNMALDIEGLLKQLQTHGIQFVLIGGLAMRAQGSAHITDDFDICYRRTPENISALAQALASLHPYLRGAPPGLPFRLDAATLQAGLNFILVTDLGDLDLLGEVSGIGTFDQVSTQAEERTMFNLKVRVLTLDGLIVSKRAAGRAKDRNHLLELEELVKIRDANR